MKYSLTITQRAEELLDNILYYIIKQLKNPQAAAKLMNEIEYLYGNLESEPKMYAYCDDNFLKCRGYRKTIIPRYDYVMIFRIDEEIKEVYIVGFFHELELYGDKLVWTLKKQQ